jgi:hypothetical protein
MNLSTTGKFARPTFAEGRSATIIGFFGHGGAGYMSIKDNVFSVTLSNGRMP